MNLRRDAIAIIGMGCRFPGAGGVSAFWDLLARGAEGVGDIPSDRWDVDLLFHPDPSVPGKMTSRRGGFLDHLQEFDAAFFGISPREAPHVDPRQRVMLEATWDALEAAGIAPPTLGGSATGVFIATLTNDYDTLLFADLSRVDAFSGAGTANSIIANRLSYFLDLRGPSLAVDTACSGSLIALHLAAESLRRGESTLAIAGGVSVNLRPKSNVFFSKAGIISPEGRCRTFDATADGIVRSDGAGVLILKRLEDAVRDGDPVVALITGTATNHGGRGNGIMAPNPAAQAAVLAEAYRRAGVAPADVQYIEAHGTGTRLGDPIEVQGIALAIAGRSVDMPCVIGSVKTNIGHTEPAAGVAGVIKVALAMAHRQIPASLHFNEPNPLIPFDRLPVRVQTTLGPWPRPDARLVAGVSGFGFGGSNAHVVLEEAPVELGSPSGPPIGPPYVLPISARTAAALSDHVSAHRAWLAEGAHPLADVCYTAAVRRTHHGHRMAVVGGTNQEVLAALDRWAVRQETAVADAADESRRGLVFVCSGQGSHWPRMGAELYACEPVFREAIDACAQALAPLVPWSLVEELCREPGASRLDDTGIAQPAIFAVQVALAALWRSWGVLPETIVGHSLGEVAAAAIAGALSIEDAAHVVVHRSRLMQRAAGNGRTAAIGLGLDEAHSLVRDAAAGLAVAGTNSPTTSVLSGGVDAVTRVVADLEARGVFARMLPGVDIAFHSPQMDPLVPELVAALDGIRPRAATIPIVSTVTGATVEGAALGAQYWGRNLREPFLFTRAVERLLADGATAFLEVSPHPVLSSAIVQTARHTSRGGVAVVPSLRRHEPEVPAMRASLAAIYELGHEVRWQHVYASRGRVVPLPRYPWQRQRFWYDQLSGSRSETAPRKRAGQHPLLGERIEPAMSPAGAVAEASTALWEIDFECQRPRYLADHRVFDDVVVPGAALLEMAQAAGRQVLSRLAGNGPTGAADPALVTVDELVFERALRIPEGVRVRVQVVMTIAGGGATIAVFSRPAGEPGVGTAWTRHASGVVRAARPDAGDIATLDSARSQCTHHVTVADHYAAMKAEGLSYGPAFQGIISLSAGTGEALACIELPRPLSDQGYLVHPVLLDAALQTVATAVSSARPGARDAYLPRSVSGWRIHRAAAPRIWAHARVIGNQGGPEIEARITLFDDDGTVVAGLDRLTLIRTGRVSVQPLSSALLEADREPKPIAAPAPLRGRWLIVADRGGVGDALASRLSRAGVEAILIPAGADIARTLADARAPWSGVVHLRGLDADRIDDAVPFGCAPALEIVQQLVVTEPARVWLVTRGHSDVPAQAPLAGLALVVAQEHPELACTLVDLEPHGSIRPPADADAAILAAELGAPRGDDRIAWRGGVRRVARLNAYTGDLVPPGEPPMLTADATYLVTGAFGALGRQTARLLVERGARHLVLTGRHGADGHEAVVRALEALGARVTVARLDVARADDVARLFDDVLAPLPPLRGIIHSAGVLDDGLIAQLSPWRFETVMAPKMHGAWNLHQRTERLALDFFILYSSAASLIGSPGQANYAAANACLDALAHHRRGLGLPALSVNWGAWAEGGMAASDGVRERMAARGVRAVEPCEGLAWLATVLRPDVSVAQIGVLPVDWPVFLRQFPGGVPPLFERLAAHGDAPIVSARTMLEASPADERPAIVRARVRQEIAAVLGVAAPALIGARDRFFDLGMDSLMVVELRNRLQAAFDVPLPATIAFDCPTLDALGTHLVSSLVTDAPAPGPSPLAALSDDEVARLLTEELHD